MNLDDLKVCDFALTHSGVFHADDCFSAAFLQIINPNILIKRVNKLPDNFNGLVFDIGNGKFDHHNTIKDIRSNGILYASFGKLWKEFAPSLYGDFVYRKVDDMLIQDIDNNDNTGSYSSLALAISLFNPITKGSTGNKEFMDAVWFCKKILMQAIKRAKKYESDMKKIKKIYDNSDNKKIVVLNEYIHFQDYLPNTQALYVIFPSKRGGFIAQGVPVDAKTNELKRPFPKEWVDKLPSYLTFCHQSRFLISADSLENIIYACKEALK